MMETTKARLRTLTNRVSTVASNTTYSNAKSSSTEGPFSSVLVTAYCTHMMSSAVSNTCSNLSQPHIISYHQWLHRTMSDAIRRCALRGNWRYACSICHNAYCGEFSTKRSWSPHIFEPMLREPVEDLDEAERGRKGHKSGRELFTKNRHRNTHLNQCRPCLVVHLLLIPTSSRSSPSGRHRHAPLSQPHEGCRRKQPLQFFQRGRAL